MMLKIGRRIINTDNVVAIEEYAPGEEMRNSVASVTVKSKTVRLVTTAYQGNGWGPFVVVFDGADAEKFLDALPVYEPVLEGGE